MTKIIKNDLFSFWKNNKINRFGITKLWGIFSKLSIILQNEKYIMLNTLVKKKTIYTFIYKIDNTKKNQHPFLIKSSKKIFRNLSNMILQSKSLSCLNLFTDNNVYRNKLNKLLILNIFFKKINPKKINSFFNMTKISKTYPSHQLRIYWQTRLSLLNLNITINYYINRNALSNYNIKIKTINSLKLLNLKWYKSTNLLKLIQRQFKYKPYITKWLLTCYITEKFKQTKLFIDLIIYFFIKNKILTKKKFSLNVLKNIEKILFFLRTNNCIFFTGIKIELSGKITLSMRKKNTAFSMGK